jgi:hypothetical protein
MAGFRAGEQGGNSGAFLSDRVGLPAVDTSLPAAALYDWDTMTRALAAQEPWWEPRTRHGYHAFTFGDNSLSGRSGSECRRSGHPIGLVPSQAVVPGCPTGGRGCGRRCRAG